ncbi:MAG: ribose-phosphate pyrophosphokinase [Tunicatimonas sp.]|uniref:ribose-phosphate pyrophosphokinase n=1 Tax=Tunicatimonas sp. TaxID=1940096 RepID=UPI003C72E7E3
MATVKIFSGSVTQNLATEIAHTYGKTLGEVTIERFSDGELSTHFNESVRGCDVFLVQSTFAPTDNLMELLLMIDAAKRASAKYVTAVVPYFGYARQDRKDKPRVAIGAKLVANLFSAAAPNRLMTCDLHAGQIQGFFDFPVDHFSGSIIFVPYLKQISQENLIFASPDVGGVKRARNFAQYFHTDMVICDKHRKRANEIAEMQVIGNVEGKDVVIVDDLVDTAGTLCKAATVLKESGAQSVRAIATHAVLSGSAYENIENSMLEELVVTDTIPLKQHCSKIRVLTVAEMFASAIKKIHKYESISPLFISQSRF